MDILFSFFENSSIWINFLLFAAVVISGQEIFSALFASYYQRYIYPKLKEPKYDKNYLPRCSIIMASKGVSKYFRKNIQAFLDQDYPDFELILCVEDESDEGVPIIRSLLENYANGKLVIAGYATSSSQTNYNQIKGIESVSGSSVLVIADNDICPESSWLRSLILPLSDPKVSVTTGYRWVCGSKGSYSEHVHTLLNMTMYANMHLRAYFFGDVVWNGSAAIRKNVFEELNGAQNWGETIAADLSLMIILAKAGKKSVLVPECLSPCTDLFETTDDVVEWFSRQLLLLKSYSYCWWVAFGGGALLGAIVLYSLMPIAIIGSILTQKTFWELGGLPSLIFYLGEFLSAWLFGLLGSTKNHFLFILRMPFIRFPQILGYLKSLGPYEFTWANIHYKFAPDGKVLNVSRKLDPKK
jgi:cellulose synthase/poly-beta-1,6-N-acetylglucosamine synthase-like glycosyltransferase